MIDRGIEFVVSGGAKLKASKTSAAKPLRSSPSFVEIFSELKRIVNTHAGFLDVLADTPTEYILTGPTMPRWKKVLWFGGVKLGKSYVSLHLMPVYMFPDLLETVSSELRARMQGKSCFNFKKLDPTLLAQVDELVARSLARLRTEAILPKE